MSTSLRHAAPALGAALLFGASTPLAKLFVGETPPLLLAGLLYLGSGVGLAVLIGVRSAMQPRREIQLRIPRKDLPWLLGAIVAGGMLGPALLLAGLAQTSAASASLLLNVEGVFTALIAWLVFKENADRRIVAGMAAIVAGGALLAWQPGAASLAPGALLVIGACLCWAIDNNLTRKVSANDAMLIACLKGLIAGACNVFGVRLHLRELHAHPHRYDANAHTHPHRHDAHHNHAHDFVWDGGEPHVHPHAHAALSHRHAHYPDLHHRHTH